MSKYDYLEYMYQIDELREKSLYDAYYTARWPKTNPAIKNLNVSKEDLKALNDTVFKEEKKMHNKKKIKGAVHIFT